MKNIVRWILFSLSVGFLFMLTGCGQSNSNPVTATRIIEDTFVSTRTQLQPCTLMDCNDTLSVVFEGHVPADFIVDIAYETADGSINVSKQCANDQWVMSGESCRSTLIDMAAEEVTVMLYWEGESLTEIFHPDFTEFRPNGQQCEPVCRMGSISVVVPSSSN